MTSPYSTDLRKRARASALPREGGLSSSRSWTGQLTLSISGIRFDLRGLPNGLDRLLALRFGPFAAPADPSRPADLTIQVRPADVRGYLDYDSQDGSKLYRLETRAHEDRLHAWSYAFAGWFDIEGPQGEISLCDSPIEPPARSIENFLRVAFAWKAMKHGGFLLHASGLVRGGRAYIFFGPSGSGKTTVTRLSPHDLRLNDDCIHITRRGSLFCASGVPFKGSEDGGAEHAGVFPIAGFFRLVQSRLVYCRQDRRGPGRRRADLEHPVRGREARGGRPELRSDRAAGPGGARDAAAFPSGARFLERHRGEPS